MALISSLTSLASVLWAQENTPPVFFPQAHFVCVHSSYVVKLPILPPASQTEAEEGSLLLVFQGGIFTVCLLNSYCPGTRCTLNVLPAWHFSLVPHFLFVFVADFFI